MNNPNPIRIATRGSALALAQAHAVLARCQATFPDRAFEICVIKTTGDKLQTASLAAANLPKGLFTKELEVALSEGQADLAVHSLKDLPTGLPPGLKLGAVMERADVRDVLIYRHIEVLATAADISHPVQQNRRGFKPDLSIISLPHRAVVATSSTRRAAQVTARRPDIQIVPIRGNVGTRLKKLAEQSELDALILAAAGLERLHVGSDPGGQLRGDGDGIPAGLALTRLPLSEMLPCVGQAAIGIEIRENDPGVEEICAGLNHGPTFQCVTAERSFLSAMGGGCQLPVGAFAQWHDSEIHMRVVSFLGAGTRHAEARGPSDRPGELGERLAAEVKK